MVNALLIADLFGDIRGSNAFFSKLPKSDEQSNNHLIAIPISYYIDTRISNLRRFLPAI